jgi:hypothetical protein
MAKWDMTDQPTQLGAIRAVNYVTGYDADGAPLFRHRLEQLNEWGWQPIPVYQEQPDGILVEIPQ